MGRYHMLFLANFVVQAQEKDRSTDLLTRHIAGLAIQHHNHRLKKQGEKYIQWQSCAIYIYIYIYDCHLEE